MGTNMPTGLDSLSNLIQPGNALEMDVGPVEHGDLHANVSAALLATEPIVVGPAWFNVKGYGAKGDGTTDDTTAIQTAINLAEIAGGGTVFLPPGVYKTTSTLIIGGNAVALVGAASLGINNGTRIAPTDLSFDVIEVNAVNFATIIRDIQIKPLATTGGSGGASGPRAIYLYNVQNVQIRDVVLSTIYNGVYVTGGDVNLENVLVTTADLTDTGRYGFLVTGVSGNANATYMNSCTVSQLGNTHSRTLDAFILTYAYNSLTLVDCGANTCNHALWSKEDGGGAPNFLVTDRFTSDHCNIGLQLDYGNYAVFDSLLVTSSAQSSVNIASTYTGGAVHFNNANVSATAGGFVIAGGTPVLLNNCLVNSISAGSTTGHCIEIDGAARVVITGGELSNPAASQNCINLDATYTGYFVMTGTSVHNGNYGFYMATGATGDFRVSGCRFATFSSFPYSIQPASVAAQSKFDNNRGINPTALPTSGTPNITNPAVPLTTVAATNPYPFDATVYVAAGAATISAVAVGGSATGMTVAAADVRAIRVPCAATITLTYTGGTPTWTWFGE